MDKKLIGGTYEKIIEQKYRVGVGGIFVCFPAGGGSSNN